MIWIAVTFSVISLAAALVALRWAHEARVLARQSRRLAITGAASITPESGLPWPPDERVTNERVTNERVTNERATDERVADESRQRKRHTGTALEHAIALSDACHQVIRALDAGGEPPAPSDYGHVRRYSELFTVSIDRMRAPQHGDLVRELTDELVTLHHLVTAEIAQHQEARYPFVGAKDTTLAGQVLRRFDAEVERLRLYAQTGSVTEPNLFPVDFETVRFVPRDPPAGPTVNP